jgi:hypothetical protein
LEIAEEHGDLIVPDLDGTSFFEVNLRTLARTVVGRGFDHPLFLNFGPGGYLYVADATRIYRFEPDGSKTPIAGNGRRGTAGDGGLATAAQLGGPGDFAFDAAGNLYIAEYDNGVRIVTPDGRIDTLAGVGREGYSGDGGRHATRRSARRTVWTSCPMGPCWSRTATTASSGESTAPPGS